MSTETLPSVRETLFWLVIGGLIGAFAMSQGWLPV